jgi:hypothetical protein
MAPASKAQALHRTMIACRIAVSLQTNSRGPEIISAEPVFDPAAGVRVAMGGRVPFRSDAQNVYLGRELSGRGCADISVRRKGSLPPSAGIALAMARFFRPHASSRRRSCIVYAARALIDRREDPHA